MRLECNQQASCTEISILIFNGVSARMPSLYPGRPALPASTRRAKPGRTSEQTVSRLSPKPIISHVVQTWDAPLGMKIALVEDIERRVWIVESCPAGTHFWTLAQAQSLSQTGRVGQALRAAVTAGHQLLASRSVEARAEASAPVVSALQPSIKRFERSEQMAPRRMREAVGSQAGVTRPLRRAARRESKVSVCA